MSPGDLVLAILPGAIREVRLVERTYVEMWMAWVWEVVAPNGLPLPDHWTYVREDRLA